MSAGAVAGRGRGRLLSSLVAVAVIVSLVNGTGLVLPGPAAAVGGAFDCSSGFYQVSATRPSGSGSGLWKYSPSDNRFIALGAGVGTGGNGFGYNPGDDYIYGFAGSHLYKVDNAGTFTDLGTVSGGPTASPTGGDFYGDDHLYVYSSSTWWDVNVVAKTQTSFTLSGYAAYDMTVLGNLGYGLNVASGTATLYIVNLATRAVTTKTVGGTGTAGYTTPTTGNYGAAYSDNAGNLYFYNNTDSYVFQIEAAQVATANPKAKQVGTSPAYYGATGTSKLTAPNDGMSCPTAASPYVPVVNASSHASVGMASVLLSSTVTANTTSPATATVGYCYSTSSAATNGILSGCTMSATSATAPTGISATPTADVPLTGLLPSTTYSYQAIATNAAGSGYGSILTFTTSNVPVVSTSAATAVTTTAATLNGTINPGTLPTTAQFCYGTSATLAGCTTAVAAQSPLAGSTTSATSAALTGLLPATTYYFRVSATNANGTTTDTVVKSFTTRAPPTAVIAATTDITATDATFNGTVNPGGERTTVTFEYGTDPTLTTGTTTVAATESPLLDLYTGLAVSLPLSGLQPNTTYYVRVHASNPNGNATSTIASFTTPPLPVNVTTMSGMLPRGIVGRPYTRTLTAAGGTGPYAWAMTGGTTLPPGLTLDPGTGTISGTPTTVGTYTFTAQVTDAGNATNDKTFTVRVIAGPQATTQAATSVTASSATLNATVNPGFDITKAGFCLATTSALSGCVPVDADESPLAATITNSTVHLDVAGLAAGTTYYFAVTATNSIDDATGSVLTFTTSSAPTASVLAATNVTNIAATLNGSVGPGSASTTVAFCWGVTLTLSSCTSVSAQQSPVAGSSAVPVSVHLTGLTANTVYYYRVGASNAVGTATSQTRSFMTAAGPVALAVLTASLADGTQHAPYTETLVAIGGTGVYTAWALTAGTLPAGLALDPATGEISGTPTVAASAVSLTFRVTDSANATASRTLTLTIDPDPNPSPSPSPSSSPTSTPTPTPTPTPSSSPSASPSPTSTPSPSASSSPSPSSAPPPSSSGAPASGPQMSSSTPVPTLTPTPSPTPTPVPTGAPGPVGSPPGPAQPSQAPTPDAGSPSVTRLRGSDVRSDENLPPGLDLVFTKSLRSVRSGAYVTADGVRESVTISNEDGATTIGGLGWLLRLRGFAGKLGAGDAVDSADARELVLQARQGGMLATSGAGFMPGSTAMVYLVDPALVLGRISVAPDGSFDVSLPIPATLAPGRYLVQVNGWTPAAAQESAPARMLVLESNGAVMRSATMPLVVRPPKAVTIARRATTVYFDAYSSVARPVYVRKVRRLVRALPRSASDFTVQAVGYVQPTSQTDNDFSLSTARAAAIGRLVSARGVKGHYYLSGRGRAKTWTAKGRKVRLTIAYVVPR